MFNVPGNVLSKVVEYCKHHKVNPAKDIPKVSVLLRRALCVKYCLT